MIKSKNCIVFKNTLWHEESSGWKPINGWHHNNVFGFCERYQRLECSFRCMTKHDSLKLNLQRLLVKFSCVWRHTGSVDALEQSARILHLYWCGLQEYSVLRSLSFPPSLTLSSVSSSLASWIIQSERLKAVGWWGGGGQKKGVKWRWKGKFRFKIKTNSEIKSIFFSSPVTYIHPHVSAKLKHALIIP